MDREDIKTAAQLLVFASAFVFTLVGACWLMTGGK